ncbi:MAG: peptidase domain-containing ABC transporter, partial [Saprospiraceae bacterium]|nr:peptidase domain-containing ABC transporter [Saprospiraceae bacterium]
PCIAHYDQNHFVVVYKISNSHVWLGDPSASEIYKTTKLEFLQHWGQDLQNSEQYGILLLLEVTPDFFNREEETNNNNSPFRYLYTYIFRYKKLIVQLVLGVFITTLLQFIFPFLMQSVIDVGINNNDIKFIYIVLLALFVLQLSSMSVELLRSWILLHIGARVNISLVSDFLAKLMRLSIRFFDSKFTGDLMQRIFDNERIERFLTSSSLQTVFSVFQLFVFSLVLLYFNTTIFLVFITATVLYIGWAFFFLSRRKKLDNRRFAQLSENQSKLIEIINGMQDIKIHGAEKQKRWAWERVQAKLFRVSMDYQALDQWQRIGATFIMETKNLIITFVAAKAVIDGKMTLGTMLAIQYVVGQLNAPLEYIIAFVKSAQNALISLQRMDEIHQKESNVSITGTMQLANSFAIRFQDVSFQYGGINTPLALNQINFEIPFGKTTAIVGTSGSGKTTLLKLMLQFYSPTKGQVFFGDVNLKDLDTQAWYRRCGVVMQDGFIFSDTIANNIALGEDLIDKGRLVQAVKVANIQSFIDALPLGFNTKIGQEGVGLSQGQRQRLLIARAIYKQPDVIFFDEATNALDSFNEMIVMDNLTQFFTQKTVVIVAHRLSTVKNADNIIVLERGELIEQGTHNELIALKGAYYYLVKNQLELGA